MNENLAPRSMSTYCVLMARESVPGWKVHLRAFHADVALIRIFLHKFISHPACLVKLLQPDMHLATPGDTTEKRTRVFPHTDGDSTGIAAVCSLTYDDRVANYGSLGQAQR